MKQLDHSILAERQRRLNSLRKKSYAELDALPEASSEVARIDGRNISFTTFRERLANDELLVLVRSDRPIFLGIGSMGATEGFIVSTEGSVREALNEDITDLLG